MKMKAVNIDVFRLKMQTLNGPKIFEILNMY